MNRKPGDWDCSSCDHLNFSWRDSCQRCGDPRSGGGPEQRGEHGSFSRGRGSFGVGSGYQGGRGGSGGDFGRNDGRDDDYRRSFGGDGDYARNYGGSFGFGGSEVRPGDWYCSMKNCGAHNFASRSSCFKCGVEKDEGGDGSYGGANDSGSRGSRDSFGFGSAGAGRSGWKSGDWICGRSDCNEHNFASRMECFRCQAPRESAAL